MANESILIGVPKFHETDEDLPNLIGKLSEDDLLALIREFEKPSDNDLEPCDQFDNLLRRLKRDETDDDYLSDNCDSCSKSEDKIYPDSMATSSQPPQKRSLPNQEHTLPRKQPRTSLPSTAQDWLENYNKEHHIADNDNNADVLYFQRNIRDLTAQLYTWARTNYSKTWFNTSRFYREMTFGFRSVLMRVDHMKLSEIVLSSIP